VSLHPKLTALNNAYVEYFKTIWWAVLLGLFAGGLIDYYVPEETIFKYLGKKRHHSLLYALLAGFTMSACSHGILAIAMQLYKKGASVPAVITFLLASPWANLPVTILLFGFFKWKALLIIGGALLIAYITGIIFLALDKLQWIEPSKKVKKNTKEKTKHTHALKGIYNGTIALTNMVLWWIIIGFLMAIFIRAFVPAHYFMQFFGPTITGLALTLLFATIIEVCSEGSAPIAFEIFKQTGALGNPFVFLMAGVATDYTEIGLIWSNIGKKTALWLPIITVPQIMIFAYFLNIFF